MEAQYIRRHHRHQPSANQCTSALIKHVRAPVHLVWSLVRRFDQPQRYKPFVSRCIVNGEMGIGSVREVNVKSGLPATTSTERLELLDDEEHILGIKIVGGDHRLRNYSSIMTVHPEVADGRPGTLVIESFVVDVPEGNTRDETCYFVEALIRCNLKSLADVSERMAVQDRAEPPEIMAAKVWNWDLYPYDAYISWEINVAPCLYHDCDCAVPSIQWFPDGATQVARFTVLIKCCCCYESILDHAGLKDGAVHLFTHLYQGESAA